MCPNYTRRDALRHLWQSTLLVAMVILATLVATVLSEVMW